MNKTYGILSGDDYDLVSQLKAQLKLINEFPADHTVQSVLNIIKKAGYVKLAEDQSFASSTSGCWKVNPSDCFRSFASSTSGCWKVNPSDCFRCYEDRQRQGWRKVVLEVEK